MKADVPEKFTINEELKWGLQHRLHQKKIRQQELLPKPSPIDLKLMWYKYQITKQIQILETYKKVFVAKPAPKYLKSGKFNTTDRSTFTRKQYINFLSTPHQHRVPEPKDNTIRSLKKKLDQSCSARLTELAKPTKLRLINTWTSFSQYLKPQVLERLQTLLQNERSLDPAFARCCFKRFDNEKRKLKFKRFKKCRKNNKKKKMESEKWLQMQILSISVLLTNFLYRGPLMSLDYRQSLISNSIFSLLVDKHFFKKKPSRNSKKPYEQAVIDVVDQISVWIDAIVRYSDIQDIYEEKPTEESLLGIQEVEEEEEESFYEEPLPPVVLGEETDEFE